MHKYIDADVLKAKLEKWILEDGHYCNMPYEESLEGRILLDTEKALLAELDEMPAADVEPVKHGKWKSGENFGGEYLRCTACDVLIRPGNFFQWHYCPNCGAKMDGGNE